MAGQIVVTLPPGVSGAAAIELAGAVSRRGADLLEIRTDLHPADSVDAAALARKIPLLIAERGAAAPPGWRQVARCLDQPLGAGSDRGRMTGAVVSHHAERPLDPAAATRLWSSLDPAAAGSIKHVEPLGDPRSGLRLLETQAALERRFPGRVTVLATGVGALPFRCLLSRRNALEYVATGDGWTAATGQRLLGDAVRERRGRIAPSRRGLLGHGIERARSPLAHRQPFDRIDLPPKTDLAGLLEVLLPFYDGFAVTNPFKQAAARLVGASSPAVNTLLRRGGRWVGANTDVVGALAAIPRLGPGPLTALGDGGVTAALRIACAALGRPLAVLKRETVPAAAVTGPAVWTWSDGVLAPRSLSFRGSRVGIVAYGAAGSRIAREIRTRGGEPVFLGPTWFIAQARQQRELWDSATTAEDRSQEEAR